MKRSEREQLIERFLQGELSSSQQEQFQIDVELDARLQSELAAYRAVDAAMQQDCVRQTATYPALRARLAQQLATSGTAGAPGPAPGGIGRWLVSLASIVGASSLILLHIATHRSDVPRQEMNRSTPARVSDVVQQPAAARAVIDLHAVAGTTLLQLHAELPGIAGAEDGHHAATTADAADGATGVQRPRQTGSSGRPGVTPASVGSSAQSKGDAGLPPGRLGLDARNRLPNDPASEDVKIPMHVHTPKQR